MIVFSNLFSKFAPMESTEKLALLTATNCPAADFILEDIRMNLESIEGIKSVDVNLVFEPEWNQDMMTEEAKLELGFL